MYEKNECLRLTYTLDLFQHLNVPELLQQDSPSRLPRNAETASRLLLLKEWGKAPLPQSRTYLGGNDEEHGLGIQLRKCFGHVSAINVGHKPNTWASLGIRLQGFSHHEGPLREEDKP